MADLKGREIFAVGTWNNIAFTESDLDDIVANFEKLAEVQKVPLKFGHNDEQPITDGQPAIGWINKVYRQGKKLLADFSNVPSVVVDAVKNKLYRTVSVELLFGVEHKGDVYKNVLDAVALLGADQPAVNTLDDLSAFLASRSEFSGGRRVAFSAVQGDLKQENDMDKKEIQEMIDSAVEKATAPLKTELDSTKDALKASRDENAELKKSQEKAAEQEKAEKIKMARKMVTDHLNAAVEAKVMTPAVRETYSKQLGVDDDARVLEIDMDDVKAMWPVTEEKERKGAAMSRNSDDTDDDLAGERPDEALLRLSREYQDEHENVTLEAAFTRVAQKHPKIHRAYLDMNGSKGGSE